MPAAPRQPRSGHPGVATSGPGAVALPVLEPRRASRKGWWRAGSLIAVHLLIALHILHYHWNGTTVSPLEPSEASYTLRDGVVNAGAIFFALLLLSTLVFGRFFCGWACHVVAYQDAARWLLMRCGIQLQAVRLRTALLLPLFAACWLYGRPVVDHLRARSVPTPSMALETSAYWATFGGPVEAAITFLVCGFLIVCILGAKGFCTYGCPYGALFNLADRFSRARIRVTDACVQSGTCSAGCSSNVDVAREVRLYGKVVDPNCLKCLDCVSNCPTDALYFGRRAQVVRPHMREPRSYPFTWGEEFLMLAAFAGCYAIFYRLYRVVPVLLAMGASAICAYLLLQMVRLLLGRNVRLQQIVLRGPGGVTRWGWGYLGGTLVLTGLLMHSGVMQWHTRRGVAAFTRAVDAERAGDLRQRDAAAAEAAAELDRVATWGLMHTRGLGRMEGRMAYWRGAHEEALTWFAREVEAAAYNPIVRAHEGDALLALGRAPEALEAFTAYLDEEPDSREWIMIGRALRQAGSDTAAIDVLATAHARFCGDGAVGLELARLLIVARAPARREPARAQAVAKATLAAGGAHADLLGLLAWLYAEQHDYPAAIAAAERSIDAARAAGETEIASDMAVMLEQYREAALQAGQIEPPGVD